MTEESSKVIDRRRLRSKRNAAASLKKKTASMEEDGEDPSAVAITTATSTGIEASLQENHSITGSTEETSESHSIKKSKKKKKSTPDDTLDYKKSPGKKSKKKNKNESVDESLTSSPSKDSSLFPSSPSKKKKKKSSSSHNDSKRSTSKRRESKTKYAEVDEDGNSQTDANPSPKPAAASLMSFNSPEPILSTKSKSRSDREEDSSLRDLKMATPIDVSVSKRGLPKLGTQGTFESPSIDDDDTVPFWKKSEGRSRRNSPKPLPECDPPSLDQDDTILTTDEDFLKFTRSLSKERAKAKAKLIIAPPLSDESDGSSEDVDSSDDEDEEPEWVRKKKMFAKGRTDGRKAAYVPKNIPKSSADGEDGNENEEEHAAQEEPKAVLPPWATAKIGLRKTIIASPAPMVKEGNDASKKDEKYDEQDASNASLPKWAKAKGQPLKKSGGTGNTTAPVQTVSDNTNIKDNNIEKESDQKEAKHDVSKTPPWAKARQKSLKKIGSTRNTVAPAETVRGENDKDIIIEKETAKKEDKQDAPKTGLPPWANARTSLKKSGSTRNTVAPIKTVSDNNDKDSTETESEEKEAMQDAPKTGLPPWAISRQKSLKKTGSTRNTAAPAETVSGDHDKDNSIEKESAASIVGVPPWANARTSLKKSGSRRNATAPVPIVDGRNDNNDTSENDSDKKPEWKNKKNTVTEDRMRKSTAQVDPLPPSTKTEPNTNLLNRQPSWAKARNSLKPSGSSSFKITPPDEKVHEEQNDKADANEAPPKAKSYQSPASRPTSVGTSLWARKKSSVGGEVPNVILPVKGDSGGDDESSIDVDPERQAEKTGLADVVGGSVKDRLSLWGKPKLSKPLRIASIGSSVPNIASSADDDVSSYGALTGASTNAKIGKTHSSGALAGVSRKVKISKSQSERSISGSTSVTSLGSKDSQGTSLSHRNRMAAYLGKTTSGASPSVTIRNIEYKNDPSKPPIAPLVTNRDQASVNNEQALESAPMKANPSATPRVSNIRGSGGLSRTSSGNLSVKNRMKAWGGSSQNNCKDSDASSTGTCGALSVTEADEDDEEKSVPSVKDRMKTWTETNASKPSKGIPTKVAITKSTDQGDADSEILRLASSFSTKENPNTKPDHAASPETDSYGRNKAKTWAAKPSPVPAYAAGRTALKKIKKATPSPEEKDRPNAPPLIRMYSAQNLKKTEPLKEKRPSFRMEASKNSFRVRDVVEDEVHSHPQSEESLPLADDKKVSSNENSDKGMKDTKEANETENDSVTSTLFVAKLRKVTPPDSSKWKGNKDTTSGSNHGAPLLRKVGKPKEQKWKEMKSADMEDEGNPTAYLKKVDLPVEGKWKEMKSAGMEDEGNPTAYLKKVSPPVEEKWKSPIRDDEKAGKLYTSQAGLLRRVAPPIEDKWRAKDESPPDPELNVDNLQAGNKKLVMLISSLSGRLDQKSAQDRALTILKGIQIDPDQLETVDGADPTNKERRDELFEISGVRGRYPQFFLVDANNKVTYMTDWEGFESMHDNESLSDSMNLNSLSKNGSGESLDSSKNSAVEFASEEASVSAMPNHTDVVIIETNDIPDQKPFQTQRKESESNESQTEGSEGQKLHESLEDDNVVKESTKEEKETESKDPSTNSQSEIEANEETVGSDVKKNDILERDKSAPVRYSEGCEGSEEVDSSPAIVPEDEEAVTIDESIPTTSISAENRDEEDLVETIEDSSPTLDAEEGSNGAKDPIDDIVSTPDTQGVIELTLIEDIAKEKEPTTPVPTERNGDDEGEVTGKGDDSIAKDDVGEEDCQEEGEFAANGDDAVEGEICVQEDKSVTKNDEDGEACAENESAEDTAAALPKDNSSGEAEVCVEDESNVATSVSSTEDNDCGGEDESLTEDKVNDNEADLIMRKTKSEPKDDGVEVEVPVEDESVSKNSDGDEAEEISHNDDSSEEEDTSEAESVAQEVKSIPKNRDKAEALVIDEALTKDDDSDETKAEEIVQEDDLSKEEDAGEVEIIVQEEKSVLRDGDGAEVPTEDEFMTKDGGGDETGSEANVQDDKPPKEKEVPEDDNVAESEEIALQGNLSEDNDVDETVGSSQENKLGPKDDDVAESEECAQDDESSPTTITNDDVNGKSLDDDAGRAEGSAQEEIFSPDSLTEINIKADELEDAGDHKARGLASEDEFNPASTVEDENDESEEVDAVEGEGSPQEDAPNPAATAIDNTENDESEDDDAGETEVSEQEDELHPTTEVVDIAEKDESISDDVAKSVQGEEIGHDSNNDTEEEELDQPKYSSDPSDQPFVVVTEQSEEEQSAPEQDIGDETSFGSKDYHQEQDSTSLRDAEDEQETASPTIEDEEDINSIKVEDSTQEKESVADTDIEMEEKIPTREADGENDEIDSPEEESESTSDTDNVDVDEHAIPVNFGEQSDASMKKSTSGQLLKMLEASGYLSDDNAKQPVTLSSFFTDKVQQQDDSRQKEVHDGKKNDGGDEEEKDIRFEKLRDSSTHSNDSNKNESNKKPMSMKSLSDHLSKDTSGGRSGFLSESSPVDEESSGGWSDDDSATIKSEYTDITYGTLGSAVVVDATALTSSEDGSKRLRRMVAAKAAQSQEDIIPGLPPGSQSSGKVSDEGKSQGDITPGPTSSAKASSGGEILFTPPRSLEESDGSESDNDGDITKKAGKSNKKKKKKKSKKSKDVTSSADRDTNASDFRDDNNPPKKEKKKEKKKKKEKEKKRVATVEEDIVFDFNENADTGTEEDGAAERSKKKKKKKKRKGDVGSSDDSNDIDSDDKLDSDNDNAEKEKKKKKKKTPIEQQQAA